MTRFSRPPPRTLKVLASNYVTPNMLRVTLGGADMDGFPEGQEGGYVKLRLDVTGDDAKPAVRTYTIRNQRPGAIDVDFALHASESGDDGPATNWAKTAQPGEMISVGGPGPAKPLPPGAHFYIVVGDMTALPAISVNLEKLPSDARGIAFIEILSADDRQDICCPAGFEIRWIINPHPGQSDKPLVTPLRQQNWPGGNIYAWSASEFCSMKALRKYLREERGLGPDQLYISSYWKSGANEDAHKQVKRADAETI